MSKEIINLVKGIRTLSSLFRDFRIEYYNRFINRVTDIMANIAYY